MEMHDLEVMLAKCLKIIHASIRLRKWKRFLGGRVSRAKVEQYCHKLVSTKKGKSGRLRI